MAFLGENNINFVPKDIIKGKLIQLQITKLEIQKKNKQRINLYLDDEFYCGLSLETAMKNHLKEGQTVTEDGIKFLITQTERENALSRAVGYISKSQKTKKQVIDYLQKKGYDEETSIFAISKLEEYHFVDDELFAKNYIKYKNKTNGSKKIKMELKQKGVEDELVNCAIQNYARDRDSIENVALKYLKNKERDLKTKQKAYRHLLSKGYGYEDINYALNKIFMESEEDSESWD